MRGALKEYSGTDKLNCIAVLLVAINFSVLLLLMFQAYVSCSLNGLDVGIYDQLMRNMTAGNFAMDSRIERERSHSGYHNQPVMYLLYPLYALFPSTFALGITSTLAPISVAWTSFLPVAQSWAPMIAGCAGERSPPAARKCTRYAGTTPRSSVPTRLRKTRLP